MEEKLKHLEFIQETINRMARNSFLLKGWTITIMSGLLAFSSKKLMCFYLFISLVIVVFFSLLDSYYLYQEKLFIKLYNHTRKLSNGDIDFSMDTNQFKKDVAWFDCFKSNSIKIFYGGLIIVLLIIIFII